MKKFILFILFVFLSNNAIASPSGKVTLWENDGKKKNPHTFEMSAFSENVIINFNDESIHNVASSMKWNLPKGIKVTFYQKINGEGCYFTIWGKNEISDLHNGKFGDCLSSFKWYRGRSLGTKDGCCKGRSLLNKGWRLTKNLGKAYLSAILFFWAEGQEEAYKACVRECKEHECKKNDANCIKRCEETCRSNTGYGL